MELLSKYVPWTYSDLRFDVALSMYPSEEILDNLASKANLLFIKPDPNSILFFNVLYDPILLLVMAYALVFNPIVWRLILAPKAAAPFVD